MSLIIDATQPAPAAAPESARTGRPPSRGGIWVRVGLAVALVATSAGARLWQQTRYDELLRAGQTSPFPLAEVPRTLGPWSGVDDVLDPKIADATGAVDAIFRTYTNTQTGVKVSLILLYGPATMVAIHAPENCYPSSGYAITAGPTARRISDDAQTAPFLAHTFARGEGGRREFQRVLCSWYYDGHWAPRQATYKRSERIPGMFKFHLARAAAPTERFDPQEADPCEDLAALLLPVIQQRIDAGD